MNDLVRHFGRKRTFIARLPRSNQATPFADDDQPDQVVGGSIALLAFCYDIPEPLYEFR